MFQKKQKKRQLNGSWKVTLQDGQGKRNWRIKRQKEKAKTFSKELNKGAWKLKTAVSVLDTKKKKIKKLPTEVIQSPDEDAEEEEEPLPEGFCLQEDRMHCINIRKSDEFRGYLHQVTIETKEIGEAEIYDRIKADMDKLPDNKEL